MRLPARLAAPVLLGALACSAKGTSWTPGAEPPTAGSGGTGAAGGGSGGSGNGGSAPISCDETVPGPSPLRLLTHVQYDNSVYDLLGDDTKPSRAFPAENEVAGFSNNVAANRVVPRLIEGYQSAAEDLAARAVSTRLSVLAPCAEGADPAVCVQAFVRSFGTQAFRRPIDAAEAAIFDAIAAANLSRGYAKAVEITLRAMLQSPQFLYRVDAVRAPTPETGAILLGGYEFASRLSYFLTNAPPDTALRSAAADGQLASATEIEAHARRLLDSPRAKEMAADFFGQWLGLSRLDGAARVAPDVPLEPTALVGDWQASLGLFVGDAVWNQGTMQALFTSPKVFVTPALASLYGTTAPAEGLHAVEMPAERAGLLTQPALMALLAHSDQSAPVLRGAFVRERILCLEVDPPPPDVNAIAPDVDPNATTRERFAQHTADPSCGGCHRLIDGVGFAFEAYDQLGRYRTLENGLPIDTSGEMIDSGEAALEGPLTGAAELAGRIASSPRARDCLATQWYRYAMGRVETDADECSLSDAKSRFAASDGNFRELLLGVVLSEAFRYRPALEAAP